MRITVLVLAILLLGASYYAVGLQRVSNAQKKVIDSQDAVIESQKNALDSYGEATALLNKSQDKCVDSLLNLAKAFELDTKPGDVKP